jgi:hypothetical protein
LPTRAEIAGICLAAALVAALGTPGTHAIVHAIKAHHHHHAQDHDAPRPHGAGAVEHFGVFVAVPPPVAPLPAPAEHLTPPAPDAPGAAPTLVPHRRPAARAPPFAVT